MMLIKLFKLFTVTSVIRTLIISTLGGMSNLLVTL